MPSRLITILILLFWLGTMGWVYYREVVPWFGTGEAPAFHIGLREEVGNQIIVWKVFDQKGERIGAARSYIKGRVDQPFELQNVLRFENLIIPTTIGESKLTKVSDTYQVNLKGELVEFEALMQLEIKGIVADITISGKVEDDRFVPKVSIIAGGALLPHASAGKAKPFELPPVDVSNSGKIISILYPQNKIAGLFEGRSWKISAFNPISASVSVFGGLDKSLPMPVYKAEVFSDELEWKNERHACWRVEVTEPVEKVHRARIWVRKSDDLVLQHEASYQEHELILRRLK